MDFFSNIVKNTATKVETLAKSASAAVNSAVNSSTANSPEDGDELAVNNKINDTIVDDQQQQQQQQQQNSATTLAQQDITRSNENDNNESQQQQQQMTIEEALNDLSDPKSSQFNSAEMSQKALESAKYLGNFLFNVANKAGQTVSATAKQIKSTVESVGIMQEFTKEQQDFIKEHGGKTDIAEPPWVGCDDEEKVKSEILSLSQDKRNFVRNPPSSVEFAFDMTESFPVALALLREDPELSKMRYELVPKLVNEETFWRNYFYRVSLMKQDPNFTTATKIASFASSRSSSSSEGPDDPNDPNLSMGDSEFVSDTFQQSTVSTEEVRKDMYKLGIRKHADDLDEELAKDLQEFEMVSGSDSAKVDEDEINHELASFDMK